MNSEPFDPNHVHTLQLTEAQVVDILAHLALLAAANLSPHSAVQAANTLSQAAWGTDALVLEPVATPVIQPPVGGEH